MTEHEYREVRKRQKLEKLFADVNLAIMVKRGEDAYDEGSPEQQQERAEAMIMKGKRFIAQMFSTGEDHFMIINKLRQDQRLVGDVSLFHFSEYAKIMDRLYDVMSDVRRENGNVINAQREYDDIKMKFAIAEVKLAEAKGNKIIFDEKFEKVKAEREAELKRLGLLGADGAGDGAGADGAGDGAGADGAGDGAGADGAGDGAGADGAGDGAGE